jgi:hypothetical protein
MQQPLRRFTRLRTRLAVAIDDAAIPLSIAFSALSVALIALALFMHWAASAGGPFHFKPSVNCRLYVAARAMRPR